MLLISSGRGYAQSSASSLGYADIVNFDWIGDGTFDHVVIVAGLPGPLISSHTTAAKNVTLSYFTQPYPNVKCAYASTWGYY